MMGLRKRCATGSHFFKSALIAVAAVCLAQTQAQAVIYNLTSANSAINVNFGAPIGMADWQVDGNDQVNQQSFWFRVGPSGPQSALSQITTTPFLTPVGSSIVGAMYSNSVATYGVQVNYNLSGQANGSGKSKLNSSITVYNFSSSPLDFHLFLYSDMLLGGAAQSGHQYVVQQGSDGFGDTTAVQSLGGFGPGSNSFVASTVASKVESAPNNTQTLNELTTINGLVLNNVASAGPGNVTWGIEWDLSIAANNSAQISMLDSLAVPEPTTGALVLVGLGAWSFLRRRHFAR